MNYIIFDTETTGTGPKDEVIQFSAIITNENFVIENLVDFYCYTQHPINAHAFNVHHISKEMLFKLSKGLTFEDQWEKHASMLDIPDVVWVDWSIGGFDQRMINQPLVNNGLHDYFTFPRVRDLAQCQKGKYSFDLMRLVSEKFGEHSMKLTNAVRTLKIDKAAIDKLYRLLLKSVGINCGENVNYHDSSYDAFATYLLFRSYVRK